MAGTGKNDFIFVCVFDLFCFCLFVFDRFSSPNLNSGLMET